MQRDPTFEPGCRNNWHIHHATKGGGQMHIGVAGTRVGSSTIANSVAVLKKSYPKIKWQTGKLLNSASEKEIGTWVSASIK